VHLLILFVKGVVVGCFCVGEQWLWVAFISVKGGCGVSCLSCSVRVGEGFRVLRVLEAKFKIERNRMAFVIIVIVII